MNLLCLWFQQMRCSVPSVKCMQLPAGGRSYDAHSCSFDQFKAKRSLHPKYILSNSKSEYIAIRVSEESIEKIFRIL